MKINIYLVYFLWDRVHPLSFIYDLCPINHKADTRGQETSGEKKEEKRLALTIGHRIQVELQPSGYKSSFYFPLVG